MRLAPYLRQLVLDDLLIALELLLGGQAAVSPIIDILNHLHYRDLVAMLFHTDAISLAVGLMSGLGRIK
jgi:hypothetical protein